MNGSAEALGRIFIAGTGRSGTTILHRVLGRHPDVWRVPMESKFIVESDGLAALVPQLTNRYSLTSSHLALERFVRFMRVDLPNKGATAPEEVAWQIDRLIGEQHYYPALDQFVEAVSDYKLDGVVMPRHFPDRAELIDLARRLVDRMFAGPTLAAGRKAWVEKTPSNILELDLLWELFPEAVVVHIKRDPRAVLHSMMQQGWLPETAPEAARMLATIYWRWQQLKPRLDLHSRRYIEIRLEDFASNPPETLARIGDLAGLDPKGFRWGDVRLEAVEYWRERMPADQQRFCEEALQPYFDLMGYAVP